jgi:hypothetical protein
MRTVYRQPRSRLRKEGNVALQIVSTLRALHSSEALVRRIVAIYHLLLMWRVLTVAAVVATLSIFIVAPRAASAQAIATASRPQAVGVVQFLASQPGDRGKWLYGIDASAELKSVHFWGVRAEISGQRWNSFATRYFAGVGPQVAFRRNGIVLHAAALEGVSRNRMWMPPPPSASIIGVTESEDTHGHYSGPQTHFAVRAGGGVDAHLSYRWLLRLAEVSYTESFSTHSHRSVEYSTGIAYVF